MRVLIAEDDDVVRELMILCLDSAGYGVTATSDGLQAWELLELMVAEQLPPGIVVIDQYLPGLTGSELGMRIRATPGLWSVPIVVVSGLPPERDSLLSDLMPSLFLSKPFSCASLRDTVTRLRDVEPR